MNRQQEYWDLIRQLDQTPEALDGTARRAKARARRRRMGKRWGISLGSAAGVCAAFVLAVNTLPTFALACANVPVLRELAAAVAFSPSLSAAVEHDYVQYIGQSQSFDGTTLTLEYVIADQQQMVVFYRVDGGEYPCYTASCDLKDGSGTPLSGYSVGSTTSAEELKKLEIHFKELEEIPQTLTLEVELLGSDQAGEDHPLDHVFPFTITLDPHKTAPAVEVPVGRWVEADGQRLLVDRLELNPTRTALHLAGDPDNTAWLEDLEFHFTDRDGTVYDAIDGTVSASGRYTYYFQSLYFVKNPTDLTLHLDGAAWLDKEAQPVTVDLAANTWTGTLPEEVTGLTAERRISRSGEQHWVVKVSCTVSRSPFELEFRDPEGGTHTTGGYSMRGDREAPGHYEFEYILEDYLWDSAVFTLSFTSTDALDIDLPLGDS
ncbi:DUF4179 domain-containing protein [Intestinimonas massiliensis (ex Afouda et al. 2020)]|uniref:DUF4179 domain-containing protein n=1 Tax=Intestinimonas massiliensis (ex Afouda et al. 2020) TaxID=1673721 RepID=UPI00103010EC|nr:DUF4179 domain-containing protein [Intestinimonas massiliensis (ex Afouda et al. 2020)]